MACALMLTACTHAAPTSHVGSKNGCPDASHFDEPRRSKLVALASTDEEARRLLQRSTLTVCFGQPTEPTEGVLVEVARQPRAGEHPVALLDRSASDERLAARLAHLAAHAIDPPFRMADCANDLRDAVESERRAHGLEARIRRNLGAAPLDPDAVDAVIRAYQARCRGGPQP